MSSRDEILNDIQQTNRLLNDPSIQMNAIDKTVYVERFTLKYGRASLLDNNGFTCQDIGGFITGDGCAVGSIPYQSGIHKIRIKVEYGRPFIGILSHNIAIIDSKLTRRPYYFWKYPVYYRSDSTYGWCTAGSVRTHGFHWYPTYNSYRIINGKESPAQIEWEKAIMEDNDIFQLIINCDRRELEITNETQGNHDIIKVDLWNAPLPWRLFVVFCDLKSRVHLLQSLKWKEAIDHFHISTKTMKTSSYSNQE